MKEGPIAVIGAGTMGGGIVQVIAQSGRDVLLADRATGLVERGITGIANALSRRVAQQRMTQADMDATMKHIKPVAGLQALKGSAMIIEAVFEEPGIKMEVFKQLRGAYDQETLLASNTSTIPITLLANAVDHPQRFIGMHFFNPVPAMRLVEIIRGYLTSEETVADTVALTNALGKTPVVVKDSPGFVANRLLGPMINEAAFLLAEGVATREDIDTVMKLGANHPMGPLELADLIGLDICLHVMETLHGEFGDSKYRPAPFLRQLVSAGHLGRKTGRGFYEYPNRS